MRFRLRCAALWLGVGFRISAVAAQTPSTWGTIRDKILTPSCTSCHVAGSAFANQSGLILTKDVAYEQLVNVPPQNSAALADGLLRVGDRGLQSFYKSFLWEKIDAPNQEHFYDDHPYYGALMPLGGQPLTNGELEMIRQWIIAGVPRTGVIVDPSVLDDTTRYTPPEFAPLPSPENGLQLHVGPFEIAGSYERELFYYVPLNNPRNLYVERFEMNMRRGSHHFILYTFADKTPADLFPQPYVIRDIRDSNGNTIRENVRAMEYHTFVSGTQLPFFNYHFPPGVALRLPPNTGIDMNSHYVNRTTTPFPGEVYANMYLVDSSTVKTEVNNLFLNNTDIELPPHQVTTITKTYTFNKKTQIFMLWSHAHELMVEFDVYRIGGDRDGELVYVAYDWEHPPILQFDPPLVLQKNEGLRMSCTYDNTTDHVVTYGLLSEDEMMILFGYWAQDYTVPPPPPPPPARATWAIIRDDILQPNCSGCHTAGSSYAKQSGLVLTKDVAYSQLAQAPPTNQSAAEDGLLRVSKQGQAGLPQSFLWQKINAPAQESLYQNHPRYGALMPLGSTALTDGQLEFIRQWLVAGAPDTGAVADSTVLQNTSRFAPPAFQPLPVPANGVQVHVGPFEVTANRDREFFVDKPLQNANALLVRRFEMKARSNSRHAAIFVLQPDIPANLRPKPDIERDLWNTQGQLLSQNLQITPYQSWLAGATWANFDFTFPDSIALPLPANSSLEVNLNTVNRTDGTSQGEFYLNLHTVDSSAIQHIAKLLAVDNRDFVLPPHQITTLSKEVIFSSPTHLLQLRAQSNEYLTQARVEIIGGPRDGETIYTADDWEHPARQDFMPPLVMASGQGLRLRYTYNNTSEQELRFGPRGEGEMMRVFGYYFVDPPAPPPEPPATLKSTWAIIQDKILTPQCTGCHLKGSAYATESGLILTSNVAYRQLNGVQPKNATAAGDSLLRLVSGPGGGANLEKSFFWMKIDAPQRAQFFADNPDYGTLMPRGLPPLTNGELAFIRAWIVAGAPDTGAVADTLLLADTTRYAGNLFEPPAAPLQGVQIHLEPFAVDGNQTREVYSYLPLHNAEDILVRRIEIKTRPGVQHLSLNLFAAGTPQDLMPQPQLLRDVFDGNGNLLSNNLEPTAYHVAIWGTSREQLSFSLPPGVALRLPAATSIDIGAMFASTEPVPMRGEAYVNLDFVDPQQVEYIAEPLFLDNPEIAMPPQATTTITKEFPFTQKTTLLMLSARANEYLVQFRIEIAGGPRDGDLLYETSDWRNPAFLPLQPAVVLQAGEGLRARATYDNPSSATITFGTRGSGEVMRIFGYAYSEAATAVHEPETTEPPAHFALEPNYPNPFNASTAITFSLASAAEVQLAVYDLAGSLVARLATGRMAAGHYTVTWQADGAPSGVYLVRLQAGTQQATRKILLLK